MLPPEMNACRNESPSGETVSRYDYYRLVVEHVSDIISVHSLDGMFEFVSPSVRQITGYTPDELTGKSPYEFIHPSDSRDVVRPIHNELLNKSNNLFRCRFLHKEGHYVWLEVTNDYITGPGGEVTRLITSARGITLRKALEEQLEQLNHELMEKNSRLKGLNKDLEEFAYAASHDLKEPLRNVVGLLRLLEDSAGGKLDAQEHEFMEMARITSDRMSRMIESLLEYSRTGYPSEDLAPIRIREVVGAVCRDFSQAIVAKQADIQYLGRDFIIQGYPTAFHRLIQNLISNALKHGRKESPRIEITATEHSHNWGISVRDDGPGIPQANQPRIFRVFNRLSKSADSNGIGLALCKRIAELHGGRIGVSSIPGNGATFNVSIAKNLNAIKPAPEVQ